MSKSNTFLVAAICLIMAFVNLAMGEIDVKAFIANMEKNDKQSVLVGNIDSLTIARGNGQFQLGKGKLTLFDFGTGRILAMVFEGNGRFVYVPPDEVERGQLQRYIKRDTLDDMYQSLAIFYTVELDNYIDTTSFSRKPVDKVTWELLVETQDRAFDHQRIYMPNALLDDVLASGIGTYFYSYFVGKKYDRISYRENPYGDDLYRLSLVKNVAGWKYNETVSAYTPDNSLPTQRGIMPIDIYHYKIYSTIESNGDMYVKCKIYYTPMRWGGAFYILIITKRIWSIRS